MITARNARSTRRRGSNNDGWNDPARSLGIWISTSPAGVANDLARGAVALAGSGLGPLMALSADRGRQLGVDQVLHPLLHQPAEQVGPIRVAQSRHQVTNSGIIISTGHRVISPWGDYSVVITESHAVTHLTGGP